MKRKIRVAMGIMFNNSDGMEDFVKFNLEHWKYRKEKDISFYLVQVEHWMTGKIYYSLDFISSTIPKEDSPDFSIKEILIK